MKITIIYDNEAYQKNLTADWGFSCLVEVDGRMILFDTGAKGDILLANMEKLSIDPLAIDTIFIWTRHPARSEPGEGLYSPIMPSARRGGRGDQSPEARQAG